MFRGRCERFQQGGHLVVSLIARGAKRSGVEARLGYPQIRIFGEQELDHLAAAVGGCPDQRVLDDQLRREHRTVGADPLEGYSAGPQPAVRLEVSPDRIEITERRGEAQIVDPGTATGESLRGLCVPEQNGSPQRHAVVVDPVDPGAAAAKLFDEGGLQAGGRQDPPTRRAGTSSSRRSHPRSCRR